MASFDISGNHEHIVMNRILPVTGESDYRNSEGLRLINYCDVLPSFNIDNIPVT